MIFYLASSFYCFLKILYFVKVCFKLFFNLLTVLGSFFGPKTLSILFNNLFKLQRDCKEFIISTSIP